ncbi:TIGR03084 family metal-binding protein [Brucella sp. 21LCYQ03]|nr:TIGR03084 family metal-binding protein [Brucella sp. 21LCYQ03]
MNEAVDFHEESRGLHKLLDGKMEILQHLPTQFKQWTIADIVRHLHAWNLAALLTTRSAVDFETYFTRARPYIEQQNVRQFERGEFGGLYGAGLLEEWWLGAEQVTATFRSIDPRQRLSWGGPSMSARSCISARLMETWAHGQAIYDLLGIERQETDRIKSIAVLGMNTFGWSFSVKGIEPPAQRPSVRLTAPSGAEWAWINEHSEDAICGDAVAFCQVVTQTRNIADTSLIVVGSDAKRWMDIAQCFAGPPSYPPLPGTRRYKAAEDVFPVDAWPSGGFGTERGM